jgi:hypothetical protein
MNHITIVHAGRGTLLNFYSWPILSDRAAKWEQGEGGLMSGIFAAHRDRNRCVSLRAYLMERYLNETLHFR